MHRGARCARAAREKSCRPPDGSFFSLCCGATSAAHSPLRTIGFCTTTRSAVHCRQRSVNSPACSCSFSRTTRSPGAWLLRRAARFQRSLVANARVAIALRRRLSTRQNRAVGVGHAPAASALSGEQPAQRLVSRHFAQQCARSDRCVQQRCHGRRSAGDRAEPRQGLSRQQLPVQRPIAASAAAIVDIAVNSSQEQSTGTCGFVCQSKKEKKRKQHRFINQQQSEQNSLQTGPVPSISASVKILDLSSNSLGW